MIMRERAEKYFQDLRDRICTEFESLDGGSFERTSWERPGGGGGLMSVMKGKIFEKVGISCSTVFGEMTPEIGKGIPGYGNYLFATEISLTAHMVSPLVPAFHLNLRYIETDHSWFGGGSDMTPSFPFEEDITDYHRALKAACDKHNAGYYSKFKKWCDEHFYLEHRKEPRGSEGIFFDHIAQDPEKDFNFVRDIGESFLEACLTVILKRKEIPFTEEQKDFQLFKRGRFVEFNLLYDQDNLFGLKAGANANAVLMSMPPVVKWK